MIFFIFWIMSLGNLKDVTQNRLTEEGFVFVEGNEYIQSFYMAKYEVTISEFLAFQRSTGYKSSAERLDSAIVFDPTFRFAKGVNFRHDILGKPLPKEKYDVLPAARITFEDAQAYAKWKGGRLPTVDEWIYAARGGKKSRGYKYPGGNNPHRIGFFDRINSFDYTQPQPIGQKEPNELGIYDMGGNLQEMTYSSKEPNIIRSLGGSYFDDPSFAILDKITSMEPSIEWINKNPYPWIGFRIVKDAK